MDSSSHVVSSHPFAWALFGLIKFGIRFSSDTSVTFFRTGFCELYSIITIKCWTFYTLLSRNKCYNLQPTYSRSNMLCIYLLVFFYPQNALVIFPVFCIMFISFCQSQSIDCNIEGIVTSCYINSAMHICWYTLVVKP